MILGIGTDLCDIRRVEKTLHKFGKRFKQRIFSENERKKADLRANPAATYAKFFAAKEAFSKALGTGISQGVYWQHICVENLESGQPYFKLSGGALTKLKNLTPSNMHSNISLSLTDEYPIANAMVVISLTQIGI